MSEFVKDTVAGSVKGFLLGIIISSKNPFVELAASLLLMLSAVLYTHWETH